MTVHISKQLPLNAIWFIPQKWLDGWAVWSNFQPGKKVTHYPKFGKRNVNQWGLKVVTLLSQVVGYKLQVIFRCSFC